MNETKSDEQHSHPDKPSTTACHGKECDVTAKPQQSTAPNAQAVSGQTILKVAGMDCPDEIAAIERVLKPLAGVREVKVNLMGGTATIAHDQQVTPEQLIKAIGTAGLKASGMPSDKHSTRARSYHPLRKIKFGLDGIKYAVLLDFSVRYKLVISVVFLIIAAKFETVFHFLFVLVITGLMLMAEIFNTAVEAICDYIQPNHHDAIKNIKDMAAGAALLAILIWYVTLGIVLYELIRGRETFS